MQEIALTNWIPQVMFTMMSFSLGVLWCIILFQLGTLLQRNREVLTYFNVNTNDASQHLIEHTSNFDPSRLMSGTGTLLKIYAIASVIWDIISIFRYGFF